MQTLHSVVLSKITPVGSLVRLFRLQVPGSDPDVKVRSSLIFLKVFCCQY